MMDTASEVRISSAPGSIYPLCVEVDGELIPLPFFPFVARRSIRVCVEWQGAGDEAVACLVGRWVVTPEELKAIEEGTWTPPKTD